MLECQMSHDRLVPGDLVCLNERWKKIAPEFKSRVGIIFSIESQLTDNVGVMWSLSSGEVYLTRSSVTCFVRFET